jgi:hypothetical protein
MATESQVKFQGFQFPTTTPVPDEVFDVLMPQLSGAELKVLLYICRRTFGFKKESDTISLHQIATGIKTRDGRVLDGGTGLCKRHVIRALKALEKKNIIQVARTVDESGLNEVNTYSLNMLDTGGGVVTKSPYGSDKMLPRVVTPGSPTTNREQETVLQETVVVDVAQDLENFGIAQSAVTRLIQDYPAQYIRGKLEMAKELVATESALVSQNPAGWLRKAIEEDYSPPRIYERHRQRHVREKKDAKITQRQAREQSMAEESQQTRIIATQYRENILEKKEPEKTSGENQTIWDKALEKLKEDLPLDEAETRLKGTALLEVTDTAARIGVDNPFAIPWLERRMYAQLSKAMRGVLGKDVDLQFVTAPGC